MLIASMAFVDEADLSFIGLVPGGEDGYGMITPVASDAPHPVTVMPSEPISVSGIRCAQPNSSGAATATTMMAGTMIRAIAATRPSWLGRDRSPAVRFTQPDGPSKPISLARVMPLMPHIITTKPSIIG